MYRGWKAIVCLEGNIDIRVKHSDWVHSISLLGAFVMRNPHAKRERDCWIHNTQKDEGVHGKASLRSKSFLPREYEPQSMAHSLDSSL